MGGREGGMEGGMEGESSAADHTIRARPCDSGLLRTHSDGCAAGPASIKVSYARETQGESRCCYREGNSESDICPIDFIVIPDDLTMHCKSLSQRARRRLHAGWLGEAMCAGTRAGTADLCGREKLGEEGGLLAVCAGEPDGVHLHVGGGRRSATMRQELLQCLR